MDPIHSYATFSVNSIDSQCIAKNSSLTDQKIASLASETLQGSSAGSALNAIYLLRMQKKPPPVSSSISAIAALHFSPETIDPSLKDSLEDSSLSSYLNSDEDSIASSSIASSSTGESMFTHSDVAKEVNNVISGSKSKDKTKLSLLIESKWNGANRTLNKRIQDHLRMYYTTGCRQLKSSLKTAFDRKIPHKGTLRAEFKKVDEGISDTRLVVVGGKNEYIVKRLALPEQLLKKKEVQESLAAIFIEGFTNHGKMLEDLDTYLTVEINKHFQKLIAPYYTGANREKMGEIIGKGLGVFVPEVEILKAPGDKIYTSHKFIENQGSLKEFIEGGNEEKIDPQSMQDIYLLDALLQNVDRHLNNVLISKDNKAIPIDHSLSLQGSKKAHDSSTFATYLNPSVNHLKSHSNSPLTDLSKKKIKDLNIDELIGSAKITHGLLLETDVINGLRERSKRAKSAIEIDAITIDQFMFAVSNQTCLEALLKNPTLSRDALFSLFSR